MLAHSNSIPAESWFQLQRIGLLSGPVISIGWWMDGWMDGWTDWLN